MIRGLVGGCFFLLLITGGLPALAAEPTQVSGKVTVGGEKIPVAGIRIVAYPLEALQLRGAPSATSAATGADGLFNLELPSGSYYFIATGEKYYSYYGRNPVTVPAGGIEELNLSLVERDPPPPNAAPQVRTGIIGELTYAGKPLAGVIVSVYTDLNSRLKGMGLVRTVPTGPDGIFEAPLDPGTYYLVARKRNNGDLMGPLRAGDYFGYFAANPIRITEGQVVKASIAMVEVPEKINRLSDRVFGETSIAGTVVDAAGEPLAGIRVLLYPDPLMLNRPLFVSQPSSAEGHFVLSFPNGGVYYLSARDKLGGPPAPGELYGRFLGTPDSSIRVETGDHLTDIKIMVEPVP